MDVPWRVVEVRFVCLSASVLDSFGFREIGLLKGFLVFF